MAAASQIQAGAAHAVPTHKWLIALAGGPDEGLFNWKYSSTVIDRRVNLVVSPSGYENAPTLDLIDDGIGVTPEEMPGTILSLQAGNKISKRYLIGAFGQGGALTLAFCDYCLIVCRHKDKAETIGFTLVRVLNLGEGYKEDCWAYLALNDNGRITVPSLYRAGDLEVYPTVAKAKLPFLAKGVLVRHYSYQLSGIADKLGPAPGNLYHYLHVSMFDPLFPFRVIDRRKIDQPRESS